MLSAIEDRYQVELNENKFTAATTVGQLEQMIRHEPASPSGYSFPRWAQRWPALWIRLAAYYVLIWPATLLLGYPRTRWCENLRSLRPPALVVANHIGRVDIALILAALPARFRHRLAAAMDGERLRAMRHPLREIGFLGRWLDRTTCALLVLLLNVFPLPRQSGYRESFHFAGELADRGYSALIFPEGRGTQDGHMGLFRTGIDLLASKLNLPVVPLRIDGLFDLKQAGKIMTAPGAIRVSIGAPIRFDPDTDPNSIARQLEAKASSLAAS